MGTNWIPSLCPSTNNQLRLTNVLARFDSEMVGFRPSQGRTRVSTAGVAVLRRGCKPAENAGLGEKMPFLDGN